MMSSTSHTSTNLVKHTLRNPIYQYFLGRFKEKLLGLVREVSPSTVLEAGCGEGFVLQYVGQRMPACRLVGVDTSGGALRYAQTKCSPSVRLMRADVYRLPFDDNAFDLVICSEVLEHLRNVDQAVAELKRVTRRYVLVSVPLEPYFQLITDVAVWTGLAPDAGHVQFWNSGAFRQLVDKHFSWATIQISPFYQIALGEV